jgi:hypothetical protein
MSKQRKFLNLEDKDFFIKTTLLLRSVIIKLDEEKHNFFGTKHELLIKELYSLIRELKTIYKNYKLTKK